jgi:S1-C subfamily serine protease
MNPGAARMLLALILAASVLRGQEVPASSSKASQVGEMAAEEIFTRFANSILFLTCDESADESSLASGVLVSPDGFIVTNAHVVEQCRSMAATRIDGTLRSTYEPMLKYYDEKSDVAVLKIEEKGLPFLNLATRPTRVGERLYAIGNPQGYAQSISEGIVSGNREQDGVSWTQHSAPISPGSSGGALIGSRGELLGIHSRHKQGSQNLNFAVPAATLAKALSAARSLSGFLDFPPNAETTGTYSGIVMNLSAGQSADFSIVVRGSKGGAIEGCMAVRMPLTGGGQLRGTFDGLKFSFGVTGDLSRIRFDGQRDTNNLSGSYFVVDLNGGAEQKGTFVLHKASSEGPSSASNILDCPSDVTLIREAAEKSNAQAQGALGALYELGRGVPQNFELAATWYRRAAEVGNAEAQNYLGILYVVGKGVPQDYVQVAEWHRKAAEQGNASAQVNLGVAYMNGQGVSQNYGESYFWIKLATAGKVIGAKPEEIEALLNVIGTHLTAAGLSQQQERAREWLTAYQAKTK